MTTINWYGFSAAMILSFSLLVVLILALDDARRKLPHKTPALTGIAPKVTMIALGLILATWAWLYAFGVPMLALHEMSPIFYVR